MKKMGLISLIILAEAIITGAINAHAEFQFRMIPISADVVGPNTPKIGTIAQKHGIDLKNPRHPLLVHLYKNGELFYVFSTTVDNASSSRKYLIQRVRKEERTYSSPKDQDPNITVTYLVEVFKMLNGKFKGDRRGFRGDVHCGNYTLGKFHKREIIKDGEIGFGEIDNIAVGEEWPFEKQILFKEIQGYRADRKIYDRVKFSESKEWSLTVAFDRSGMYSIRSPELGFNAPNKMP